MSKSKLLHCRVIAGTWIPLAIEDEEVCTLFDKLQEPVAITLDGQVVDCRKQPPFLQILPCPQCGVKKDRNHDLLMHVDKRLGTIFLLASLGLPSSEVSQAPLATHSLIPARETT